LASCYFEINDMGRAQQHIDTAQKMSRHNRFVVDLQCTIAIRTEDLVAAEKALGVLERVDPGGFYEHRRSTFEQARGNAAEALRWAEKARESLSKPPFEVVANLANCQIEMNRLSEAGRTLRELQVRFPDTHHDAKLGLRCKLEIRRGDVNVAEILWKQIRERETRVHMGLRLALLNRKALTQSLSEAEAAEQQQIMERLRDVDWERSERLLGSVLSAQE
jgi:uncharacterized protein HemY